MLNMSFYLWCVKYSLLLISDVVIIVVHLLFTFNKKNLNMRHV